MENKYLISICIPTFNRCDVLEHCLDSIVKDPVFSSDFEVVISDNNSTDNTEELVNKYINKFSNVKYYKNETNVGGDRNFIYALERAKGEYLKLLNDYSVFLPNGLGALKKCVEDNVKEKPVIYISHNVKKDNSELVLDSLDDLLILEKWGLSWIGNYGYWKEDFSNFAEKDRWIETRFLQVDWLIRSFEIKKKIVYCSCPITKRYPFKSKQGGYNFFKVHAESFFLQFQRLVNQGKLQPSSLEIVKKDVLINMISWIFILKFDKKHFSYSSRGQFKILKKQFGQYPWFYPTVLKGILIFLTNNVVAPFYRKIVKPFLQPIRK